MRESILFIMLALLNISQASCQSEKSPSNNLSILNDNFDLTLSFYKGINSDSAKVVSKYGLKNPYKIVWSVDRQSTIDNPKIILSNQFGLQWRFDFAEIDKNMPFFNKLIKPLDTISANQRKYNGGGNQFVASRYILKFHDDTLLTQINRSNGKTHVYRLTDSLVKAAMYLHYGRNDEYEMSEKLRLGTNIHFLRKFADLQVFSDTISVLAAITVTEIDSQTNTDTRLTQYIFNYKDGKLLRIYPVVHGGFVDGTFYVIGENFIGHNQNFYLQAGNTKIENNDKIFAEFALQNGKYTYRKLLNDTLPTENLNYGFYYHATDFRKDFPYYIIIPSTSVRNILTGKEYNLTNLYTTVLDKQASMMAKLIKHAVYDFKIDKNLIAYMTIVDDGNYYYVKYDLERNIVIERQKLWDQKSGRSYPSIDNWDGNYLIYWQGTYIIRQRVNA